MDHCLDLKITFSGDVTTVELRGKHYYHEMVNGLFGKMLLSLVNSFFKYKIIIDMSSVETCSSTLYSQFMELKKELALKSGKFVICVGQEMGEKMGLIMLEKILPITKDKEEALKYLS